MQKLVLYHGSSNKMITPTISFESRHSNDYGGGFYLTEDVNLAKEWASSSPIGEVGFVHKYELNIDNLQILDLQKYNVLNWIAELMKNRELDNSKRYRMLSSKFIEKYGLDSSKYDVIKGWRADASYFLIIKEFVQDNVSLDILEDLLKTGGVGIQYCIKSKLAFDNLTELQNEMISVDYAEFNTNYNKRDFEARNNMRQLIDSDANKTIKVFSTLI